LTLTLIQPFDKIRRDPPNTMNKDLVKIISQAHDKKIYGSVEVYFENGQITQITQRIINKMPKPEPNRLKKSKLKASEKPLRNNTGETIPPTQLNHRF
jgi:hypothetical protein